MTICLILQNEQGCNWKEEMVGKRNRLHSKKWRGNIAQHTSTNHHYRWVTCSQYCPPSISHHWNIDTGINSFNWKRPVISTLPVLTPGPVWRKVINLQSAWLRSFGSFMLFTQGKPPDILWQFISNNTLPILITSEEMSSPFIKTCLLEIYLL